MDTTHPNKLDMDLPKTCLQNGNPTKRCGIPAGRSCAAGRVCVVFALFLCVGCDTPQKQAARIQQRDDAPTTMQSSNEEEIRQGLLKHIVKPYYTAWSQKNRERYFDRMKKIGELDVEKRDQKVLELVSAVGALENRRDMRILILEHLGMRNSFGTYDAVFLSSAIRGEQRDVPELAVAGLDVIQVDRERWAKIQSFVEPLMRVGGSNNGFTRGWDGEDITVISYFDGTRWQVEMWVAFGLRAMDWETPLGIPAHVQTLYDLLYYINTKLDGKPHFEPNELEPWRYIGDPEEQRARERLLRGN